MTIPKRTGTNPVRLSNHNVPTQTMIRLQRMARELRMTDQILSVDVDSVSVVDSGPAPAWTSADGANVTINAAKMPGITLGNRRNIAVWLGTNAHELFHNLFTPRADTPLMRRLTAAERSSDRGIYRAWNVLEDQRIERLGLVRFAPWRGYLVAALSFHIAVNTPQSWLLVAGRTWLSDSARAIARREFVAAYSEADASRAAQLIGAYQRLADPGDADAAEAWDIITEFFGLWGPDMPERSACGTQPIKAGEAEQVDDSTVPVPTADEVDEQESDDDESDDDDVVATNGDDDELDDDDIDDELDGDDTDDDADGDDDAGGAGDDDADESDDDADGDDTDDDADGRSEGGESDPDDDGDDDESDDDESEAKSGSGTGHDDKRTVRQAIDDDVDDALDDDDTAADLDRVVDSLAHGPAGGGDMRRTNGQWRDASETARLLARDVSAVLADIRDECEAAWIRRTDTGRFSVDRWATDPDWDADNVFDLFDPGAMDATSLDLVLVLDISASMAGEIVQLAEATWAIRQAVDRIEGTVTCLGFGVSASLMFDTHERPDGRMFIPDMESSTEPAEALREACRLVTDSTATNRIVLVLTDGAWWNLPLCTEAMQACNQAGATTCVVGLGKATRGVIEPGNNFAKTQITAPINSPAELVPVFRQLAETSMRAAAGR